MQSGGLGGPFEAHHPTESASVIAEPATFPLFLLSAVGGLGGLFFFSSRRRHTTCSRDWSSDVCSSDLSDRNSSTPTCAVTGWSSSMGRRLALLIATYQYQDPELRQLTAPAHDADALAAVLRDPDIAGFEVTMLVNKPHHRVGQAIGEFYRDPRRDDLTLLYFTGHGLKDDHGRLYLAMVNTRRDSLLFTALSAEHIDQAMEGCASRQIGRA